jgi:hypothetical protein
MSADRMRWCVHAIGWTRGNLARRSGSNSTTLKRLESRNRLIPDVLAIWLELQVTRALTPIEPLERFWEPPADWDRPAWLKPEWCPPGLPMMIARMMWCLHVVGWTLFETNRRYGRPGVTERWLHEMIDARREIPLAFAAWLEVHTRRVLSTQPTAPEWRSTLNINRDYYEEEDEEGLVPE